MRVQGWMFRSAGEPLVLEAREEKPGAAEVLVEVAGCGVCHTDLGYYYDGVPTRHALPLTLGHEISGKVVETGDATKNWLGREVVVPAVIPCGECAACRAGKGSVCPTQIFPGNDDHGGFATHVKVPAHGLCPVPDLSDPKTNPAGVDLRSLSVIADAVSTPYQSILRSGLGRGDLAIVVGAGGIGGFCIQLAATMGAIVVAIDVDQDRLELMEQHGANLTVRSDTTGFKELRKAVKGLAKEHKIPTWRWKIFECSGAPEGQSTAFGLVGHGSYLSVTGFTPKKLELRLSNLMAFDAIAQGNWGCLPEHYPAIVDLVLQGKIALGPFVETRPMSEINDVFKGIHERRLTRRVILIPEA